MKNIIKALCLTFVLSAVCFGQTTTDDEYKKNEYYVGYTNQQSDDFIGRTSHGVGSSYTRNVSRYVGIKGDFSAVFNSNTFSFPTLVTSGGTSTFSYDQKNARYNFLGGVQIKDNASKARFKPFAHALAGVAVRNGKLSNFRCTSGSCPPSPFFDTSFTETDFSTALGGGLDIKINDRVDFRAFQVDYNPTFGSDSYQNSVRIGVGFVFK